MNRLLTTLTLAAAAAQAYCCTNLIVTKGASADGSVMCTYSADSYGAYMDMLHLPAATHKAGEMRKIYDWDSGKYLGEIPEAPVTYNVLGNINEHQLSIAETTFGGREEMADSTGLIDYGSLIYIALQRAKTAREAISVMTQLVEKYGYYSEGETFTICDPNEAWIMEMMGQGAGSKKVVWVALRVPDGAVTAHANQSRIRTFNQKDKKNVLFSRDVIKFARAKGWFSGKDADFSFRDAYAAPDFGGRRFCDARVWALFNHLQDMTPYLDWALGHKPAAECKEMPLWIFPKKKLTVADAQRMMRDHYEGTPLALDADPGEGVWQMPYRPSPLTYEHNGKTYFSERPVSTQQSAFTFVSQLRSWMPREVGGIIWFGNDDANMVPYVPVYCGNTLPPACFSDPVADDVTYSDNSAFWVCNYVSNMVYPRYSLMFPTLQQQRDGLDSLWLANQAATETRALELYKESPAKAQAYLTDYSNACGQQLMTSWHALARHLIVKYNDMVVKPEKDGKFLRNQYGHGERVTRPGMPQRTRQRVAEATGERLMEKK